MLSGFELKGELLLYFYTFLTENSLIEACSVLRCACVSVLTHVELSDEAGHVVVFEELWKNLFGEATLIKHVEACSALQNTQNIRAAVTSCFFQSFFFLLFKPLNIE